MFLRSKVQEMILRRRSRSMNGAAQHHAGGNSTTAPCDADSGKGHAAAVARSPSFAAAPRLLHSSSLPAGGRAAVTGSPARDSDATSAYAMSPTSVLDATAAFASSGPAADAGGSSKRRPWCDGCAGPHGLADALDCAHEAQRRKSVLRGAVRAPAPALVRSCSLDRRVEFGVKNKSSWLPLRAATRAAAEDEDGPSSEDYTCVISRGDNPRTVHIFGDRVVEGDHRQIISPPAPPRQGRGILTL